MKALTCSSAPIRQRRSMVSELVAAPTKGTGTAPSLCDSFYSQETQPWSSSIKTVFSIGYRLRAADAADTFIKLS